MPLTKSEKIAGRKFRDDQQAALTLSMTENPPDHKSPNFLSHTRHECPGRRMISTAIELKEKYILSPAYYVTPDGTAVDIVDGAEPPVEDPDGVKLAGGEVIPAGRFGFIYKEGKCKNKGCGQIARSPAGRFVDAFERPPVEGRVARQSA